MKKYLFVLFLVAFYLSISNSAYATACAIRVNGLIIYGTLENCKASTGSSVEVCNTAAAGRYYNGRAPGTDTNSAYTGNSSSCTAASISTGASSETTLDPAAKKDLTSYWCKDGNCYETENTCLEKQGKLKDTTGPALPKGSCLLYPNSYYQYPGMFLNGAKKMGFCHGSSGAGFGRVSNASCDTLKSLCGSSACTMGNFINTNNANLTVHADDSAPGAIYHHFQISVNDETFPAGTTDDFYVATSETDPVNGTKSTLSTKNGIDTYKSTIVIPGLKYKTTVDGVQQPVIYYTKVSTVYPKPETGCPNEDSVPNKAPGEVGFSSPYAPSDVPGTPGTVIGCETSFALVSPLKAYPPKMTYTGGVQAVESTGNIGVTGATSVTGATTGTTSVDNTPTTEVKKGFFGTIGSAISDSTIKLLQLLGIVSSSKIPGTTGSSNTNANAIKQ